MKLLILLSTLAVVSARYSGPINQAGLDLIKSFESWKPNFYDDGYGYKTIGYGHACHVNDCSLPLNGKYTPPLTPQQGNDLLASDLSKFEPCVKNAATLSTLNDNQYSALVSFAFNAGCGAFQSSTLLKKLNSGDTAGAASEFGRWINAGGQVSNGLIRRRESERALFCSSGGCDGDGGGATGAQNSCSGTVDATSLTVRNQPSTSATVVDSLKSGARVSIASRVSGSSVNGNSFWFQVPKGYVSAYYISSLSPGGPSWCSKV